MLVVANSIRSGTTTLITNTSCPASSFILVRQGTGTIIVSGGMLDHWAAISHHAEGRSGMQSTRELYPNSRIGGSNSMMNQYAISHTLCLVDEWLTNSECALLMSQVTDVEESEVFADTTGATANPYWLTYVKKSEIDFRIDAVCRRFVE